MSLDVLGWNSYFQDSFSALPEKLQGAEPARVIRAYKHHYKIQYATIETLAEVSGKFRYTAVLPGDYPVVGDWVVGVYDKSGGNSIIHGILPRKTSISRKAPGTGTVEQVIAANIDIGFIVTAFDRDFNERRLERYLTLVYESGVQPVIIINKADICEDTVPFIQRVGEIAIGTTVIPMSTKTLSGCEELKTYLSPGKTTCFFGSSGVGKSSIINMVAGEELLKTGEVRKDGKGKHTTTHRELFILSNKGIVIDNPGMREIQLWADEDTVDITFTDIITLSEQCRFHDCTHMHEPGCAVLAACASGDLDEDRYNSYVKQKTEVRKSSAFIGLTKKEIQQKRREEGRKFSKLIRKMKKEK